MVTIDPLSAGSLLLEPAIGTSTFSRATGFVVKHDDKAYLVTNWHVVAGRDPSTNASLDGQGRIPTHVRILHNGTQLGSWITRTEDLYTDTGKPRWLEHPRGREIDVVLLPLAAMDPEVQLHALDLSLAEADMLPQVAMPVSIIGFPLALTGPGAFPVWKTGHIASEPELDFDGKPVFLIDE